MERVPMTPRGYALLVDELRHKREVERPQIVRDIEEARAHGDISENSEYEDAKHRQSLCEGRLRELEGKIAAAEVIDVSRIEPSDRIVFGVTVDLEDVDSGESVSYKIVGTDEADVKLGLVSVTSPIGRALVGRELGDEIQVKAPGGLRKYVVSAVRYV
jgi:transcription elongation factor GreA